MRKAILTLILTITALLSASSKNDQVTVIISLDGFRWDYTQWYDTPFLDRMAEEGVEAALIPSYPSKTFPNHYTLATGLYPDHHGIIGNKFINRATGKKFSLSNREVKHDAHYYGGEPIWLTAQRQGLRTAVFYWPGSDVAVQGKYPDKYFNYDQEPRLTFGQRIDGILKQLRRPEAKRPQLIMAYFEQPDHNGHVYGPQAKQTRIAVMEIDKLISNLYERIQKLPISDKVNFIVVSDHGMTLTMPEKHINARQYLKKEWYYDIEGDAPANVYARDGYADSICQALQGVDHIRVWHRSEVPYYLHYGTNENVGDVVIDTELGWLFSDKKAEYGGTHGYDPSYNDMHALFRAVGPAFKHISLPHFPNVDVYPLLCHLLGIEPAPNDGSLNIVKRMLR